MVRRRVAWLIAIGVAAFVAGCSGSGTPGEGSSALASSATVGSASAAASATTRELPADYLVAVQRARTAGPEALAPNLVALAPGSPDLVFNSDGTSVQMVQVTTYTGYASQVGQPMTLSREVWLTPYPQVQDFCRSYVASGGTDPALRLMQYVGIPPETKPLYAVTLMVPLNGMFRPTPDPQIDDTTAIFFDGSLVPDDPAFPNHADWFRLQKALAYDSATPYPWTGMGYTFDWGNLGNPIGASEFVARPGTTVDVVAVQPAVEYCTPAGM